MTPSMRAAVLGAALSALHLYVNGIFAFLAITTWSQGAPQDYDTAETMTGEALIVARSWIAALPLLITLVAAIALLYRGHAASRLLVAAGVVMLLTSNVLGAIVAGTVGGFGW